MASRKIEDLHPIMREKVMKWLEDAKKRGIDVLIYCTYRSPEEQLILHMQGRLDEYKITVDDLNKRRKEIGLSPISASEALIKVTNAKPWESFHQYGLALDCVPLNSGKPDWNNIELYRVLSIIGKEYGLEWAGEWKSFKEYAHFQDTEIYNKIVNRK